MNIVVIGAGGQAKVVLDILRYDTNFKIVGIIDRHKEQGETIDGHPLIGTLDKLPSLIKEYAIHGAIVAVGDNNVRKDYFDKLRAMGLMLINAIHPASTIAENTQIGQGVVVCQKATICVGASIGDNSIINTASIIEHETNVGAHTHIAPGVNIAGRCTIKDGVFIGIGSTIISSITVGKNSIIGAGSIVIRDIPKDVVAVGTPARVSHRVSPDREFSGLQVEFNQNGKDLTTLKTNEGVGDTTQIETSVIQETPVPTGVKDNLTGKNVLVTGGAGFIGSTLVRELLKEGANVVVLDNFLSGHKKNIAEVQEQITLIEGDIRDANLVDVLRSHRIEYVFNLAAEPYIPHCYDRPTQFFEINANGALNLLLACKQAGVRRILQYSSSEVYGTAREVPMTEDHITTPFSTYAVSKLAADRLSFTLFHEKQIPVIILRQFNVYGPRETHPYIIPELISQLSKSHKLKLGNIKARRDLTYVTDAARGAIELIKHKSAEGEVFNLGSGTEYSIEQMAQIIGKLFNRENIEIEVEEARLRPLDVERLLCDGTKVERLTGWTPQVSFEDGLRNTIKDYMDNGQKWLWETTFAPEEKIWHMDKEKV